MCFASTVGLLYEYVTCGSVLKLWNTANGVRLHSHDVKYGSGSGQQVRAVPSVHGAKPVQFPCQRFVRWFARRDNSCLAFILVFFFKPTRKRPRYRAPHNLGRGWVSPESTCILFMFASVRYCGGNSRRQQQLLESERQNGRTVRERVRSQDNY